MGGNINLHQTSFAGVLSALVIDADKDFGGFNITNLGAGGHNLNTKLGYLDQDVKIAASPTFAGINVDGAAVFNESGADKDFRVEGDTDQNLLFLDASTDKIGVGTAEPVAKFHLKRAISGAINILYSLARFTAVHDVDMGDGFGGGFYFGIQDNAGVENIIAGVSGYRDGADNSGKLGFFVTSAGHIGDAKLTIDKDGNVGIGTTLPQGKLHVGDQATNYLKVAADGEVGLVGTARVERHWLIDPARFRLPAANYPAESFEGLFYTLDFDKSTDESAYCEEHVPYRWDSLTDIEVEVWWLHDSVDAGVVVWGIEYLSIKEDETVGAAGTTITQASAGNHTAGELQKTTFSTKILHANLETHDAIAIRLFRDADNGSDTLNEDARVVNVCFHFIMNKLGQAT